MAIGSLSDFIVLTLTRRNNGYKEPEMRLWAYALCLLLAAVGYFTYGWGATAGSHWMAIAVGLCCMIAQQVSATSIATAYAMECFDQVFLLPPVFIKDVRRVAYWGYVMDRYPANSSSSSPSAHRSSTSPSPSPCSISSTRRVTAGPSRSLGFGCCCLWLWAGR